jgi:hypothetical protein
MFDRIGNVPAQLNRLVGARHLLMQESTAVHRPLRNTAQTDFFGGKPFHHPIDFRIDRFERDHFGLVVAHVLSSQQQASSGLVDLSDQSAHALELQNLNSFS